MGTNTNKNWKNFFDIGIKTAIILFVFRCIISFREISVLINNNQWYKALYNAFGYIGEATLVSTIIMTFFNKVLWKWKLINRLIGDFPVLSNEYEGHITFIDGNNTKHNKKATMLIKQTYLDCSVKFKTDESVSNSLHATIEKVLNENKLIYIYINEPKTELRDKSQIHYGTVMLRIDNNNLCGEYYTSRQTKGSIEMMPIIEKGERKSWNIKI